MSTVANRFLAMTVGLGLAACGDSSPQQPSVYEQRRAEEERAAQLEAKTMSDLGLAIPELRRRLAERIRRSKGLLIVERRSIPKWEWEKATFSFAAMPVGVAWTVRCDSDGLRLALGPWSSGEISEGSGDVGPDVLVQLTTTRLTDRQCADLVVAIGESVSEITRKDGH